MTTIFGGKEWTATNPHTRLIGKETIGHRQAKTTSRYAHLDVLRRGGHPPRLMEPAPSDQASFLGPRPYSWLYALVALVGIVSLGMIWTPSMALLADAAERRGFDQSTAAGMMNVAWAPGFAIGGIVAGVLAETFGDAVPYVLMSAICIGSLMLLGRRRSV